MLGLMVDGKPLLRAYSIASPSWDDGLDFYSIKVADGPLTSRLQQIEAGESVLLGKKPTGTLVLDALLPGKRLFLLSTGTGFAPFASLLREPETYEKFDTIIATHTCRARSDIAYSEKTIDDLADDPLVGEFAPSRVRYYPTLTREPFRHEGRITDLIKTGRMFSEMGISDFDPAQDRVMICGSTPMLKETGAIVEAAGFEEGSNARPGNYVVEKAFAG